MKYCRICKERGYERKRAKRGTDLCAGHNRMNARNTIMDNYYKSKATDHHLMRR